MCTGAQTCWNRKGTSPKNFTKLKMENCPQYAGKLKHFDFLSLELRGPGRSKKNNRTILSLLHYTLQLAQNNQAGYCFSGIHQNQDVYTIARKKHDLFHRTCFHCYSGVQNKNGDIKARWSALSMHCTVSNINITKIQIFT